MKIYLERLLDEELLFGLVVRFVGVFAVLFILMVIMYAAGAFFHWYDGRGKKAPAEEAAPGGEDGHPERTGPELSAPTLVPAEVAAAISLGIRRSAAPLSASGLPVVAEVAAAVAMALSARPQEQTGFPERQGASAPHLFPTASVPEHSPWKLLGRQDALSGNDPWRARPRTGRKPTNTEAQA